MQRKKTASERRAQRLRAEGRRLQHVLCALNEVHVHRGGQLTNFGNVLREVLMKLHAPTSQRVVNEQDVRSVNIFEGSDVSEFADGNIAKPHAPNVEVHEFHVKPASVGAVGSQVRHECGVRNSDFSAAASPESILKTIQVRDEAEITHDIVEVYAGDEQPPTGGASDKQATSECDVSSSSSAVPTQAIEPRAQHILGFWAEKRERARAERLKASSPSVDGNALSEMSGSVENRGGGADQGITHSGLDFADHLRTQLRSGGITPWERNRDNIEGFANRLNRVGYSNAPGGGIDLAGFGDAVTGPFDPFANSSEGFAELLRSIRDSEVDGSIEGADTANQSRATSTNAQSRRSSMSLS